MKNVLIFTYYWPPSSAVSVWRFLKMSKFLPEYGWQPIIVTVKNGAFTAIDPKLEEEVPDFVEVHRTKARDPYRIYNFLRGAKGKQLPDNMAGIVESKSLFKKISFFIRANFFIPDPKIGWVPYAVKRGAEIIESRKIDAIITTGPPNSVHLIGLKLKKRYNLPWVMDMRDPWTSYYLVNEFMKRSQWAVRKDKRLEASALASADCVTGVSHVLMEEFEGKAADIRVISNGYDDADFDVQPRQTTPYFDLCYIGSLKPNQNIAQLWEALAELNEELPDFKQSFRIRFTGNLNPHINAKLEELGLKEQLELEQFVPHKQAIAKMQQATLLLFIIPQAGYARGITTGKLFEYLASGAPIFSIGPTDGEAASILRDCERDAMIDWHNKELMKAYLTEKFLVWKSNGGLLQGHTSDLHHSYSRKALTGQLADVLNEVCR